jgi:sugar phosphate isomerase/epimerase
MRVGISSYTFPWAVGIPGYPHPPRPLAALELVERADEWGATVVQVADNLPLENLSSEELLRLRRTGLTLEAGTRGVDPAHLRKYLGIANLIGAPLLRTLTHTKHSRPRLAEVESCLREVLPDFERAGVSIALENYEAHTACELAALVERVGSARLGVCLDTVNSFGAFESLETVIESLAPHVINLHIKDFDIVRAGNNMGFSVVGRPAGEGKLNVPWLLEQIDHYGRQPSIILEQWPPFVNTISETIQVEAEWAARGFLYLKNLQ